MTTFPWCRTGKTCYAERDAIAKAQLWRETDGQPWRAYPCIFCQAWHITSHLRHKRRN
ncbi:MAG TPA: hypothetical protein VGG82_07565 [Casimicrobiaceae bacterium]|jgi:hypothetical protein